MTLLTNSILSIPQLGTETEQKILEWIFMCIPAFSLGQGIEDIYNNYMFNKTCHEIGDLKTICKWVAILNGTMPCCAGHCGDNCIVWNDDYLGWTKPGIGREVVFMCVGSVIFFSILLTYESQALRGSFYAIRRVIKNLGRRLSFRSGGDVAPVALISDSGISRLLSVDDDVKEERDRLAAWNSTDADVNSVVLKNVTKYYESFLAVDGISVAIPKGECFGLLGVNGAGKTTTFKMLTGDETINDGNAFVGGFDIKSNLRQVQQRMGYCPQFDALVDQMTGRETLIMYARLKGIREREIPSMVDNIVKSLSLEDHVNKQTRTYSGGNKRKLSTAIALVGNPEVVLLDEPTTGMDPVARRLLWDTLSTVREMGRQSIILTSHSMEECEALCTRMAIMVNGKFKCLGSSQRLKTKFGNGYTIMARMANESEGAYENAFAGASSHLHGLVRFIEATFPGAKLKDEHQGVVHYWVPEMTSSGTRVTWALIFEQMEKVKREFHVEDYSVAQTTLEQIFLNFARGQKPEYKQ